MKLPRGSKCLIAMYLLVMATRDFSFTFWYLSAITYINLFLELRELNEKNGGVLSTKEKLDFLLNLFICIYATLCALNRLFAWNIKIFIQI